MNLLHLIQDRLRSALTGFAPDVETYAAMVKPTQDAKHGDYQANCAMSLAKTLGKKPRDLAQQIADRIPCDDMLEQPEVAGPGFINLRLQSAWLAKQVQAIARDERLGVAKAAAPQSFVIDFSSPNVAKPMHVGHLRSTIIGDSLSRLLSFLGHRVIRDNHLGDWGTQFGMLLYGYKHFRDEAALLADPVAEMLRIYKVVRGLIKAAEEEEDEEEEQEATTKFTPEEVERAKQVRDAVRQETAKLHQGDAENLELWKRFMPWGLEVNDRVYRRLGVRFDVQHGESFYQPMLASVVEALLKQGIAEESQGAIVVHLSEGKPPAMIRKRDGAFTYTTSDLAAVRYRMDEWHPDAMLYVVDYRQAMHFQNFFEVAGRWGYDKVALEHVQFGTVLDESGRPMKTRAGDLIGLSHLLDEAVGRAGEAYEASRKERLERGEELPDLSPEETGRLQEVVGIGAVKYADLCQNRESNYKFSWSKMLAMNGNTATYMQYAYVRNRGIFRKASEDVTRFRTDPPPVVLETPPERALALQLLRLEERLTATAAEYQPTGITTYLWDLAKTYSGFFQTCPVLRAETLALRDSRLLLCDLTARVLQRCLDLLGIQTVERM